MGGIARPSLPLTFKSALAAFMIAVMIAAGPAAAEYDAALYAFNRGDYATAARQFEAAARDGDSDAQYWLGRIYADGLGRPRDPVTAYGWFDRAAAQGHHDASTLRDGLAKLLTPGQIAEARRRTDSAATVGNQEAPDLIAAVQRELNRLGYRSGPADGIAGNRTRRAIEQFQRDAGLEVTGAATQSLLDRLNVSTR
jgi:localization factor PodJL